MNRNRNWLLILCLVLVVALGGTVWGFAQSGGLVPGVSGRPEPPHTPTFSPAQEDGKTLGESGSWTIGESSGIVLQSIELSEEETPPGGKLTVTLGASGCISDHYFGEVTFAGLESGQLLKGSAESNPSDGELILRISLLADGPADTYALRTVRFSDGEEETAAFYSRGSDERSPSAPLLPAERSFRIFDPNGELVFLLSDPELVPKLKKLGDDAKATVLYGAKDQENYQASAAVFEAVQNTGRTLCLEDGNAQWTFLPGSISDPQELNLEIRGEYGLSALEELVDWATPHYAFRLEGDGPLPGAAEISLQIGQMSRFEGGGLTLYRYDETAGSLALVASGLSADDGTLDFRTARRGVYLLCKGQAQPQKKTPLPEEPEKEAEPEYLPIDEGDTEWFTVRDQLDGAEPGATVSVRIEKEEPIPYWIIRYLYGKDVRLTLSDGSQLVTMDGLSIDIPQRQPVFKLADLQELFS
ncbi:MAG: hypothetical protein HFG26_05065 [Provencibacterium sp.]|nr:hypothetical protein [Provencibacterium sp.]